MIELWQRTRTWLRRPLAPRRPLPLRRILALIRALAAGQRARWMMLAAVVGGLTGAMGTAWLLPRRVVVEGVSMMPALHPGDRLVVVRWPALHPGAVVAVRDPRTPSRILVKRVTSVLGDEVVVHGDDPTASTDSRVFGPLSRRSVVGTAVLRYSPRRRIGRIPRRDAAPGQVGAAQSW